MRAPQLSKFVIFLLCGLLAPASAQMSECKSITDAGTRLACYDRIAASSAAPATSKPSQRPAPPPKADVAGNGDSIGAEDAMMNARLKNICRGC